jgi:hypothetical protein
VVIALAIFLGVSAVVANSTKTLVRGAGRPSLDATATVGQS